MMALLVLFVSLGLNVNFHFCTTDGCLFGSFGDASHLCEHCRNHHHNHMNVVEFQEHLKTIHFDAKCCCDDFDSRIQFTGNYNISSEKHLSVFFTAVLLPYIEASSTLTTESLILKIFSRQKIPFSASGKQKIIFFSSLKLDPLIF